MKNTYIVTYDIVNDKRRTKAHKILKGHGEALQYSVFRCDLSPTDRVTLKTKLWEVVNLAEDRVVVLDLGPTLGRAIQAMESWGKPIEESPPADADAFIL